jgi:hypothetical protein
MVFTAEVLSAQGGGHAVVVPKDVAATFSSKRPPVLAHINGVEYRSAHDLRRSVLPRPA